jgi:hypothetical protein
MAAAAAVRSTRLRASAMPSVVATEAVEEKVLESQRRRHPWDARLPLPQSETVEAADRSSRTVGGGLTLRWLDQLVSESFWLRLYVWEGIMAATASHDKLEYISMANVFMDKFSLARS